MTAKAEQKSFDQPDETRDFPLGAMRPMLGICVGMQVLFSAGVEHGVETTGLDVLPGLPQAASRAAAGM